MPEKYKYRLQPCPSYDVEGMEAWLEDMAAEGLLLIRDGFFFGFGEFLVQKPDHKVRYRLVARQKNGGLLSDGTVPDDKALEISEDFGWEFVTHRGDFYIYRTTRADAREMDTDPEVQALAMNAVRKRRRWQIGDLIVWALIYPLIVYRVSLVRSILALGTPFALLCLVTLVWNSVEVIRETTHINRLYRRLKNGDPLERKRIDYRRAVRTQVFRILRWLVTVVCIVSLIVVPIVKAAYDEPPISSHEGKPPFATLADYGEEYVPDSFDWTNNYREWSDLLASVNYEWNEDGKLTLADGSRVDVHYDVEYHELRFSWAARLLAREIKLFDKWENRAGELLDLPDLGADYAIAYECRDMYETVVLVYGNVAVRAQFYQYSNSDAHIPLADWTRILADSLK